MKKKLFHTDKNAADDMADAWETQKGRLQGVIDLYNVTCLPALVPGDLKGLFNDTTNFLFDKLTNGEPAHVVIGAINNKTFIPLDKEQAINILQKPPGYESLIEGIKQLAEISVKGIGTYSRLAGYNVKEIDRVFVIDIDGDLYYSDKTLEKITDAGNYYINSIAGDRIHNFALDVAKAYYANKMDKVTKVKQKGWAELLDAVVETFNDKEQSLVTKPDFARLDNDLITLDQYM